MLLLYAQYYVLNVEKTTARRQFHGDDGNCMLLALLYIVSRNPVNVLRAS
jgi:hypothetical protein